jgi:hypothetical protein
MKVGAALEHLHASQGELAQHLRAVAERHASEHDIYHVGHALADKCEELAEALAPFATAYGQRVGGAGHDLGSALAERVRRTAGAALGRSERAGILLLRDLRELWVEASETEIDWVIVRQGAMAARDMDLVRTCDIGITQTEGVVRWLKTRIKESSPQILMT